MLNDLKNRDKIFSYEKFYDKRYNTVQYREATAIITDSQAITVVNNNDGYDDHTSTLFSIFKSIYGLNISEKTNLYKKATIVEEYSKKTIIMRIITGRISKMIWITMPPKISNNQLALLEYYREKYGESINKIALLKTVESDDNYLIGASTLSTNNFDEVIEYAKGIVSTNLPLIEDKHIIGNINIDSIESNRKKTV